MMLYMDASTYSMTIARSSGASDANVGRRNVNSRSSPPNASTRATSLNDAEAGRASNRSRATLM